MYVFVMLSIFQSQFKKTDNFEHSVVLLLFVFMLGKELLGVSLLLFILTSENVLFCFVLFVYKACSTNTTKTK